MRQLYIYCGVVLCLIAACLVFLTVQPMLFPVDTSVPNDVVVSVTGEETPKDTSADTGDGETAVTDTTGQKEEYVCPARFTEINSKNPDAYAWISIPGTVIDYPIVQSPTSDAFYLRRDVNGNFWIAGSIMTEHSYNSTTFDDPVTVVYGHCMTSGAMFGELQSYYSTTDGIEDHKIIEIYLPDKKLEYEVFAAVPYDMRHILYNYDFTDPGTFMSFFKSILSIRTFNSAMIKDEFPNDEDKVLILSTCLQGDSTKRFLVMAKMK